MLRRNFLKSAALVPFLGLFFGKKPTETCDKNTQKDIDVKINLKREEIFELGRIRSKRFYCGELYISPEALEEIRNWRVMPDDMLQS